MISVRRRGVSSLAVAIVASGLIAAGAIATAGPAAADEPVQGHSGAKAVLNGLRTHHGAVIHDGGRDTEVSAGLFEMSVDNGGTIQTYSIDIHNPTQNKAQYEEKSWGESSLARNEDAGKIRWILQHSYPQVNDLDALAGTADTGTLTTRTAAAGTQVAIWRLSDKADVEAIDPQAEKLADYLEKNAQDVAEPAASLTLENPAVSGKSGGSMMGSGGMIVMDETTCMVDVAKYFMNFLKDESCEKCTSCREGTKRMHEILTEISEGRGKPEHIDLLEELGWVTMEASLCALGGTAPNPALSTIKYFRKEYEEHILNRRCPAKVCRALLHYRILSELCTACGRCAKVCPEKAITGIQKTKKEKGKPFEIDPVKCIQCGLCLETCKFDASL